MGQNVLIYDDKCYFCALSVRFMKKMDVLHVLKMVPSSITDPVTFNLTSEKMDETVWVIVYRTGKRIDGFRAILYCALTSPPLFPLFLFMLILSLAGEGDRVYNKIASNRYLISRMIKNRINL
jgi:predicted DCC family thiol-disulfide oxidoreductase YuxK